MNRSCLWALCAFSVLLSGCGGLADTLGLGRNAPDEFAVVERPPLAIPPGFDLRPPKPGAPRPQNVNLSERVATTMYGSEAHFGNVTQRDALGAPLLGAGQTSSASEAEKALLASAGADKVEPGIRDLVDRDAAQRISGNDHLVDSLLWWRKEQPSGTLVDPAAEAARIKEAAAKGQPLNKGQTPVIERSHAGFLGL